MASAHRRYAAATPRRLDGRPGRAPGAVLQRDRQQTELALLEMDHRLEVTAIRVAPMQRSILGYLRARPSAFADLSELAGLAELGFLRRDGVRSPRVPVSRL